MVAWRLRLAAPLGGRKEGKKMQQKEKQHLGSCTDRAILIAIAIVALLSVETTIPLALPLGVFLIA